MGTLGKAAGVAGAFVAAHPAVIETLLATARSYVFTTAAPPLLAEALRASLRDHRATIAARRAHLTSSSRRFRAAHARGCHGRCCESHDADPAPRGRRQRGGGGARRRRSGTAASGCRRSVRRRCRPARRGFASRSRRRTRADDVDALADALAELAPRVRAGRPADDRRAPRRLDRGGSAARAAARLGDALGLLGPARAAPRAAAIASTRSTCRGTAAARAPRQFTLDGIVAALASAFAADAQPLDGAGLVAGRAGRDALGARPAGARRPHRPRRDVAAIRRGRRLAARDVGRNARPVRRRAARGVAAHDASGFSRCS